MWRATPASYPLQRLPAGRVSHPGRAGGDVGGGPGDKPGDRQPSHRHRPRTPDPRGLSGQRASPEDSAGSGGRLGLGAGGAGDWAWGGWRAGPQWLIAVEATASSCHSNGGVNGALVGPGLQIRPRPEPPENCRRFGFLSFLISHVEERRLVLLEVCGGLVLVRNPSGCFVVAASRWLQHMVCDQRLPGEEWLQWFRATKAKVLVACNRVGLPSIIQKAAIASYG